ncbi:homoserine dehydrogenase [Solibacillus kalamii]|uniref:Homoserine dehydrogenase n=1 Tax=Solibacillus kalamii TaxID=1748298 RepID=A0ABX3ZHW6_9BACL|nr:homoserine dehydrogenase [Solibacillus kalamii]MBM7665501.1 homoserine dehydrogenase [Solibacillus kalamii]OUZ39325.1 homoserine dehydrogenase [Solibacillus kalamii]
MATIKAAILGFGTVGQGIYHILNEKRQELREKLGVELEVAKILVTDASRERVPGTKHLMTESMDDVLAENNLQVVFEAIVNEEPAFTYLKRAVEAKCHVVTANKVMLAKRGEELEALAKVNGVFVGFEATVAGGVPIIKTMKNILLVNEVSCVQGILNGTTNYILTKMRAEGWSFEQALREAQQLGYAEADPFNDVSGQDAFKKLMILSSLAFGEQPNWADVEVIGIDTISSEQVAEATAQGLRYRHVAEVEKLEDGTIHAKVAPLLVNNEHPLYPVDDVFNAVTMETNYIGTLSVIGPGAGMYPTASVMVEDYAEIIGKRAGFTVTI